MNMKCVRGWREDDLWPLDELLADVSPWEGATGFLRRGRSTAAYSSKTSGCLSIFVHLILGEISMKMMDFEVIFDILDEISKKNADFEILNRIFLPPIVFVGRQISNVVTSTLQRFGICKQVSYGFFQIWKVRTHIDGVFVNGDGGFKPGRTRLNQDGS